MLTTRSVVVTPAVSTTPAYTAGDNVGGKLTIPVVGLTSEGTIAWIVLTDKGKQNAAMQLIIFFTDPSNTTFTDNGALTVHDLDLVKIGVVVAIAAADYVSLVDSSVAAKEVKLPFAVPSGGTLYGALVTSLTPTYTSVSDLQLRLNITQQQ